MTASVAAVEGRPTVRIRGTAYPVLLPTLRDPRLHLAGVIVSLQVLGQTAFDFQLSIAQILVSLATCAVLEVTIAFWRQRVIMWPASALLTGNGVAFVLRVPGTEHGDWWSMHGWWLFAGAAGVGLLSKYLITFRGRHVFNPSNAGLVLFFLVFGPERADPLPFWWGAVSFWLAVALVLIVGEGLAIIGRLHLLGIAVGFWLTFTAGIAVLAISGHEMTAAWHVGPITGFELWRLLVTSPEILVFLFFMITDPRTIPASAAGRRAYAVAVGFLAVLLIAPWTSEFSAKVAVLGALAIVCAARPLLLLAQRRLPERRPVPRGRRARAAAALGVAVAGASIVVAGIPARPSALPEPLAVDRLPDVTVASSTGVARIDAATARRVASDLILDLADAARAVRERDRALAARGATGARLTELWQTIRAARGAHVEVTTYRADRLTLRLRRGDGQGPPIVVATLTGFAQRTRYGASADLVVRRTDPRPITATFELQQLDTRYLVSSVQGARTQHVSVPALRSSIRLTDVAAAVGLDFRHGAFRFGVTSDETAMMGAGVCWLDYDRDGWLDLYAVNGYAESDIEGYDRRGGLPSSRLYRNVRGRFVDVTARTHTGVRLRGSGCVAADLDGNGATDLFVTAAGYDAERDAYDALLWNNGDGTFTEGAWAAGIRMHGWHAGAAVADVNGDGRMDVAVAGYTDPDNAIPGSQAGYPSNHDAARDLLYLNVGRRGKHPRFREVGREAGLEPRRLDHGLGVIFLDANADGRQDLLVANDLDPNRLYVNLPAARPLGFRLVERGQALGLDDRNAGMGIAAADFSGDELDDVFVTNARGQLHAAHASRVGGAFTDARPTFVRALGQRFTGWGATWVDLDLDGALELAVANGAVPVTSLRRDAERVQVVTKRGALVRPLDVGLLPVSNARGLAAADYDNDGDVDLAVGSVGGRLQLLRNDGARRGHWLEVALPRVAPGTRVTAVLPGGRKLVRVARAGSSYLSSEDPRLHFGLADAARVREVVVRYPDGRVTRLRDVHADRIVRAPG